MDYQVPPAHNTPPPIIAPPASRPARSSGRGWMVLAVVLGVVVLFLTFGAAARSILGGTAGRQSGVILQEQVVEDNRSQNKIAIVDVEGLISSQAWDRSGRNMVDLVEDQLRVAGRDKAVKAVILKVDSPGGEVLASDDISRAISDFQERLGLPVVAAMGGLAASGGYYVSAPCQWIVANELTITGSIGVILNSFNYRSLMDKVGVSPQVFKSGRFKDMLSGSKKPEDIDPKEQEMIQAMVDETFGKFKRVVAEGRARAQRHNADEGRELSSDWEQYADGRILTGKQAFDLGFVDELGNFQTAVRRAKQIAGIGDADLVRYQEPFNFSDMFRLFGESKASQIRIDLGLDLPKLQAGRLYFLSPTLVH